MSNEYLEAKFEKELEGQFGTFRVEAEVSFQLDGKRQSILLKGGGTLDEILSRTQEVNFSMDSLMSDRFRRKPRKGLLTFLRSRQGVKEKFIETEPVSFDLNYNQSLQDYIDKRNWIISIEYLIGDFIGRYLKRLLNQHPHNVFELYDDYVEKIEKVKFKVNSVSVE